MPPQLFDSRGAPLALGKELGKGGEGAVYELSGQADCVGKIYLKPPSKTHGQKLITMTKLASEPLLRIAAWPIDTLHDQNRQVIGFTMPRVVGHEPVFKVYGPKLRLREFPKADWRFLIHAAANVARSFSTIHAASLVIGDVNHGNLMVGRDATVTMIDCDSFQIISGNNSWLCEVGVGTHQPPEMQGLANYKTIRRSPNHDNFGLAVIIFQLLCIARHPFSGVFKGAGDPPSIEDAIAASRYAYSIESNRTQMMPPAGSLPVAALGPKLQGLFERAFSPSSRNGTRPSADMWVEALDELQKDVQVCSANKGHYYRHHMSSCPWCEIESRSGVVLFPISFDSETSNNAKSIAAIWQQISAIPEPPAIAKIPDTPSASSTPSAEAKEMASREKSLVFYSWIALATSVALSFAATAELRPFLIGAEILAAILVGRKSNRQNTSPFNPVLQNIQREWDSLIVSWRQASEQQTFAKIRQSCLELKSQHNALPTERLARLRGLQDRQREQQLEEHLDLQAIGHAKISGIKAAKIATLASYGIHTANDIVASRILLIPGFGPSLTKRLMDWRATHERTFRFDPSKGIPPGDLANVERDILLRRSRIEAELSANIPRLQSAGALQLALSQEFAKRAAEIAPRLAQARADAIALPGNGVTAKRRLIVAGVMTIISGICALDADTAVQSSPLPLFNDAPVAREAASTPVASQAPAQPTVSSRSSPAQDQPPQKQMIMTQAANVRAAPEKTSAIVQVAKAGKVYRIFGQKQGWIEIGNDTPIGWVYSAFLRNLP